MKKILILLIVAISSQLNCGVVAANEINHLQSVGDFPTQEKEERYA